MERKKGFGEKILDISDNLDKAAIAVGAGLMLLGSYAISLWYLGIDMVIASGITFGISRSFRRNSIS